MTRAEYRTLYPWTTYARYEPGEGDESLTDPKPRRNSRGRFFPMRCDWCRCKYGLRTRGGLRVCGYCRGRLDAQEHGGPGVRGPGCG